MITGKYTCRGSNALKGFLSGSLIMGSIINPYSIIVQVVLLIIGFLMLLDAILIFGKNVHPATTSAMAVTGAVVAVLFTLLGYIHLYLSVMIFLSILLYVCMFAAREKTARGIESESK